MNTYAATLSLVALLAAAGGAVAGFVWARKRCARTLARQALRDPLTGLPNQVALLDALGRHLSLADRMKHPLTVLMAEIDNHDQVAQRHGAAAARQVVLEVSRRIAQRVRSHDMAGHWDVRHFVIVLPDADVGSALVLAADLREAVACEPVAWAGQSLPVTISVGVHGRVPTDAQPLRDLAVEMVVGAERALENTVSDGPNRTEIEP